MLTITTATNASITFYKVNYDQEAPTTFKFGVNFQFNNPDDFSVQDVPYLSGYSSELNDSEDCYLSLTVTYLAGTLTEGDNHECTLTRNTNDETASAFSITTKNPQDAVEKINAEIQSVKDVMIVGSHVGGSERNLQFNVKTPSQAVLDQFQQLHCHSVSIVTPQIFII